MFSKELLKGTLTVMILKMLSEKEKMYGYEMSLRVKELTEGKIILKDGSLYPALQKLTNDGLLSYKEENVGGRVRKYYYLTKNGQKKKAAYVEELKDFFSTVNKIVFPEATI